ncbi:MAG TPA: cytochrome c [Bryobacteraceae bacterium]|nr:cytochrome c [Bryobacteraceae bacterium]
MIFLTLLFAAQIKTASGAAINGARIFAEQCSVPYCHGAGGSASRAPAVAGRGFTREQLRATISKGRPQFGMPAFASKLNRSALDAVVSYILNLPPPASASADTSKAPEVVKLSKEEAAGRDLFFDSERLPSCGTCHAVNSVGGSVAAPILNPSFTAAVLNSVKIPGGVTVKVAGKAPFPALRQPSPAGTVRLVDFSSPLPVVRTFREGEVELSPGMDWKHRDVVGRYSAAELQSMLLWLRAVLSSSRAAP